MNRAVRLVPLLALAAMPVAACGTGAVSVTQAQAAGAAPAVTPPPGPVARGADGADGADAVAGSPPARSCNELLGSPPYDPDDPFWPADPDPRGVPQRTIVIAGFELRAHGPIDRFPTRIRVRPGETWTVHNCDIAVHRLRFAEQAARSHTEDLTPGDNRGSAGPDAPDFVSGSLTMPAEPGTYHLACAYHPKMRLRVLVATAGQPAAQ